MHSTSDSNIVNHVLRNKNDYYRIFNLERSATNDQIKSAYKKMALKCHPDKNKHPNSAEAFKIVGQAHTTLIDPTKRRIYDQTGPIGVQEHERSAGRREYPPRSGGNAYGRNGGPAEPRDFFDQFFFGNTEFRQYQHNYHGYVPRNEFRGGMGRGVNFEADASPSILMIIPILVFLFLALLLQSNFIDFSSQDSNAYRSTHQGRVPSFSLIPSQKDGHTVHRVTSLYGIHVGYYTTPQWDEVVRRRSDILQEMERDVLKKQERYLANLCKAEKHRYHSLGRKVYPSVCTEYDEFRSRLN